MFHRKSDLVARLHMLLLAAALWSAGPAQAAGVRVLHSLLDGVLANHVNDGYVDYPEIARSVRFYRYLEVLAEFDLESLQNEQERMAFWINAYNALAIKAVIDGVTPVTARGRRKFFAGSSTASPARKSACATSNMTFSAS